MSEYKDDYILLKWGSMKSWRLTNPTTKEIFEKWANEGVPISAMSHRDTEHQKELLCELIDNHEGTIQNDWSGDFYTKEQAKDYIMNYDKR